MESSNSEAQNIGPPSVDRREGGPYTVVGNDLERNSKDLPKKRKTADETMATCSSHHSAVGVAVRLLFCFLAGIVFGVAFEKSRVFEPKSIQWQFVFKRWIMLKMFLAAVATGQLCLAVLSLLPWTKDIFMKAQKEYVSTFKKKGILTSIVGPFILGCGMALSGACPGMVLAQVGAWTKNAVFTLVGALLGALTYGLAAEFIVRHTKPLSSFKKQTVHGKTGVRYAFLALPMALVLLVITVLLEYFIPWRSELDVANAEDSNVVTARAWPPAVGGTLIGLLQIVIVLAVGDTLGGSSSYVTLTSQWVLTRNLQEKFPYLAKARWGLGNWWQVAFVCAAVIGAIFSSLASDTIGTTPGVHIALAIPGGFLMLLGARFAAGCTSGHGLSGTSLLAWLSLIALPCMFGGGIVTAFILQAADGLHVSHTDL